MLDIHVVLKAKDFIRDGDIIGSIVGLIEDELGEKYGHAHVLRITRGDDILFDWWYQIE